MQILQWLVKVTHEQAKEATSNPRKKEVDVNEAKANGITILERRDVCRKLKKSWGSKLRFGHFKPFALLFRKDIAKNCFYNSLNLRRLKIFDRHVHRIHGIKLEKEDIFRGLGISEKADSISPDGNKMSPVTDPTFPSSKNTDDQSFTSDEKKNKLRGDKTKTMSRMKELVRWAAAGKLVKGSVFVGPNPKVPRNRGSDKAATLDYVQPIHESFKISFRWEAKSYFKVTAANSKVLHSNSRIDQEGHSSSLNCTLVHDIAHGNGNWIRTDSEFVVLEL